jgi:hypothetical protein
VTSMGPCGHLCAHDRAEQNQHIKAMQTSPMFCF